MYSFYCLIRKEFKNTYSSPLVYIVTALFIGLLGTLFFQSLLAAKASGQLNSADVVVKGVFGTLNSLLLFVCSLVTMRSFSDEKKHHTLDLLLISKLSVTEIVVAKFISAMSVVFLLLGISTIFPIIIYFSSDILVAPIAAAYLGTILNISFYVSVGLLASSLTENQIIAAILSFTVNLSFLMLAWTSQMSDNFMVAQIIGFLSPATHVEAFIRGAIRSSDIIFYISSLTFFGFATKKSVEAVRW
ncbi:MAG: ABC transporter permease [Bacteriovoracaceae bacterium]|nr:ABC transporter permease [Bacteriovoracaceae bacterium]